MGSATTTRWLHPEGQAAGEVTRGRNQMHVTFITSPGERMEAEVHADIGERKTAALHIRVMRKYAGVGELVIHVPTEAGAELIKEAFEAAFEDQFKLAIEAPSQEVAA
jgi:hypothetical protein